MIPAAPPFSGRETQSRSRGGDGMSEYGKALSDSGNNLERPIPAANDGAWVLRKLHAKPRQASAR